MAGDHHDDFDQPDNDDDHHHDLSNQNYEYSVHSDGWADRPDVIRGLEEVAIGEEKYCSEQNISDFYKTNDFLFKEKLFLRILI